jgi:hypothetical protein
VKEVIGPACAGVLGSDLDAGPTSSQGLPHRCWVHSLRALHNRKKKDLDGDGQLLWAKQVTAISEDAIAWAEQGPDFSLSARTHQHVRVEHQHAFEQRLWALCQPLPHTLAFYHILCERMERFLPEMFPGGFSWRACSHHSG